MIGHHYTVEQQKNRLPLYLQDYYVTRQLDRIEIDGNVIHGYFEYSYLDEKSYFTSPIRSSGGVIDNLNSYATFLTPRLVINFKMADIEMYRTVMKLLQSKNEFTVSCYDIVWDKRVTHKMYFAPTSMPKVYQKYLKALGVQDLTLELIGTNAQLDLQSVIYHLNPPSSTGQSDQIYADNDVPTGSEVLIGSGSSFQSETFGGAYRFKNWNTVQNITTQNQGFVFVDNKSYTVNNSLVLYSQWEASNEYSVSYNYGLGAVKLDSNNQPIYSKQIIYNSAYGTLPTSTSSPSVIYLGQTYYPYSFDGWYKTPQKGVGSVAITSDTLYTVLGNSTIYQLYNTLSYTLTFNSNGGNNISATTQEYGSKIYEPIPSRQGYTFGGWYKNADLSENSKFTFTTMPPVNTTLYAKWVASV